METRNVERKKLLHYKSNEVTAEDDRISDLPDEIVHRIFSFSPLEDVAKTCVLSKRWKYLWYSYPCLDFSTAFYSSFVRDSTTSGNDSAIQKQSDRIDEVLWSLEKHCDVRILKFLCSITASTLARLMRAAVTHNVQEVDLEFYVHDDYFELPHCIINSSSLRRLRLRSRHAIVGLPPLDAKTNCFKSLQILFLHAADFCNHPSNLFTDSLFPSLANLHLGSCWGLDNLKIQMAGLTDLFLDNCKIEELAISTEKLQRLTVVDCLFVDTGSNRVVINAPLLENICWLNDITDEFVIGKCDSLNQANVQFYLDYEDVSDSQMRGVANFLNGISQCESLSLNISVIEILSSSVHLAGVQWRGFNRLKSLEVFLSDNNCQIWNEDFSEALGFREDDIVWESESQSLNLLLGHSEVEVVRITGFKESSNDINLVKLLLKHGEMLQQLWVEGRVSPPGEKTRSEITEFPKASSNARIIFL